MVDIGFKGSLVNRAFNRHGSTHARRTEGRHKTYVFAIIAECFGIGTFAQGSTSVQTDHAQVCSAFINHYHILHLQSGNDLSKGSAGRLVTLTGSHCLFLSDHPMARSPRHIVLTLIDWCCSSAQMTTCSASVASR